MIPLLWHPAVGVGGGDGCYSYESTN